jgi:SRSO17 transposase
MFAKEPVTTWIIDDTGFLKQGTHSVGVQRQYTGSAGKIANCQIGVSLCIATPTEHLPVDLELYLPEAWAHSPARRRKARIPDEVTFKTKIELAIGMMRRATEARLPGDLVLADSFYGRCSVFRAAIRELKKEYAVAVDAGARVWAVDAAGRRYGDAGTVRQLAGQQGHRAFRRYLWRDGTRDALVSRLHFARVVPACDDTAEPDERERVWLIAEWPEEEAEPAKFVLSTLPARLSKKQITRLLKCRWRTERMYEDLKGELGLDHFEGRSYPGWHHPVSVVLCCYAFVVAERVRHFSPSRRRSHRTTSHEVAA